MQAAFCHVATKLEQRVFYDVEPGSFECMCLFVCARRQVRLMPAAAAGM